MPNLLDEDWDIGEYTSAEEDTEAVKDHNKKRKERKEPPEKEEQESRQAKKKKPHKNKPEESLTHLTQEDLEELERIETMDESERIEREQRKHVRRTRVGFALMTAACVYLVVLIYGTAMTRFEYGESGEIEPVVLSVEELQTQAEYKEVLALYLQERSVYEEIISLDYRLAKGEEEPATLAPKYEEAIDDVDSCMKMIEASDVGSGYNQLLTLMDNVVRYDMYNYCKYVSTAITNNDSSAEANALEAKEAIENDFQSVTSNIIALGEQVKGVDLTDVKDWSPSNYVASNITGIDGDKAD